MVKKDTYLKVILCGKHKRHTFILSTQSEWCRCRMCNILHISCFHNPQSTSYCREYDEREWDECTREPIAIVILAQTNSGDCIRPFCALFCVILAIGLVSWFNLLPQNANRICMHGRIVCMWLKSANEAKMEFLRMHVVLIETELTRTTQKSEKGIAQKEFIIYCIVEDRNYYL